MDPYFSKESNINLKLKRNFVKFNKINKKFDIILISVGHKYFKKLGIRILKLTSSGRIFDLKSIFKIDNTSFRL